MKKGKTKSLKKLQEELLELLKDKYYDIDEEVSQYIDDIDNKYSEMRIKAEKRKEEKLKLGEKVKNIFVKISLKTLQFCDKLITKEKISNQIMGYKNEDLDIANEEIKQAMDTHVEE